MIAGSVVEDSISASHARRHLRIRLSAIPAIICVLQCGDFAFAQRTRPLDPIAKKLQPDRTVLYKSVGDCELRLHVFEPIGHKKADRRSAFLIIHGGGWSGGHPWRCYPFAEYFRRQGMLAITIDYRLLKKPQGTTVFDCVRDGRSAVRYLRQHADEMGVDPKKIVVAGCSAGGHVAAGAALFVDVDDPADDTSVSCVPDALVLYYPVIDTSTAGYGQKKIGADWQQLSPVHHVRRDLPPTIIFHGTGDTVTPYAGAKSFHAEMRDMGNDCEFVSHNDGIHGYLIFELPLFEDAMQRTQQFLAARSFVSAKTAETASQSRVSPFRKAALEPTDRDGRKRELLQQYYESLEHWGRVVRTRVKAVPDKPGWKYIGRLGNVEDDVRPTAYAAMVLSFLAECEPPRALLDDAAKAAIREESIGLLRYLTASHVANGGTCLNGKPWGGQWQSALWCRAVAMATWQSWEHLDEDLQNAALKMIVFEADRFIEAEPKSSVRNDTGAEENAWNASIVALASNMLPAHPRARAWETASKKFMYNTFSVRADAADETTGDDGRPIRDWVTTVNAHDDFVVENHGLVHVGYLKNSLSMLQENAIHWTLTGRTSPQASRHHVPEVFDVLCKCMNWNAAAIYFGGNDWRIYETQCSDIIIYSMLRQLASDHRAARLEDVAFEHLRRRQNVEGGFYNGRRDLEYGGMCATRLISCFYAHAVTSSLTPPMSVEDFDASANGVTEIETAHTVIHRTQDKFASFTWAQKRMALAIPSSESSVGWPHFSSYTGVINAEHSSHNVCELRNLKVKTKGDGFAVSGTLVRCKRTLLQDFYYASPAGAYTVYVERLRLTKDFRLRYRKTGIIGLEYAIGHNHRTLTGAFGTRQTKGTDSPKETVRLQSDWLNIDDRIGYIVRRTDGQPNVMLYHDKNVLEGRKPHLQESIALISENATQLATKSNWACVVTFLNQRAEETAAARSKVTLAAGADTATVSIGGEQTTIEFGL